MSDLDHELFERELARLRPAKPPRELVLQLAGAIPIAGRKHAAAGKPERLGGWWSWCGWATAAAAAVAITAGLVSYKRVLSAIREQQGSVAVQPALKADNVEIDQQLVATFDAVGQLPDGEPIRLRCRQWRDEVILRDSARGVVIERQSPRLEVVPVKFETY